MKRILLPIAAASMIVLMSGCADSNDQKQIPRHGEIAGFWHGIWHGMCAPISFVGIMFGMDIGIYESHNTGNWYNFGFLLGIGTFAGGATSNKQ